MPDPNAIMFRLVPYGIESEAITYLRVERDGAYDPPPAYEPFVWEEWIIKDRLEKYGLGPQA